MRRSAVRTLERAGVPRSTAMQMVGHKTESIYKRYAIVDAAMLREAAARLDAWAQMPRPSVSTGTVRTFKPKVASAKKRRRKRRHSGASLSRLEAVGRSCKRMPQIRRRRDGPFNVCYRAA
jgi:hypothetical protein